MQICITVSLKKHDNLIFPPKLLFGGNFFLDILLKIEYSNIKLFLILSHSSFILIE